jgi:hypothetical protein
MGNSATAEIDQMCNMCSPDKISANKFLLKDKQTMNFEYEKPHNLKAITRIQSYFRKKKAIGLAREGIKESFKPIQYTFNFISEEQMLFKTNSKILQIEKKLPKYTFPSYLSDRYRLTIKQKPVMLKDGSIYHGSWDSFLNRHGFGTYLQVNGCKFVGCFERNIITQNGRLIDKNGDYYEGEFLEGKSHGKGVLVKENGTKYVGYWKFDLQDGEGEEIYIDGAKYVGQFVAGEKCGFGQFFYPDGSNYEGMFFKNSFHGKGCYRWSDCRMYTGDWMNNKMHGFGVFLWPDGKKYEGNYKNDIKEGFGIYCWNKDKFYEGQWENGKRNGVGTLYCGATVKMGIWSEGKFIKDFNKSSFVDQSGLKLDNSILKGESRIQKSTTNLTISTIPHKRKTMSTSEAEFSNLVNRNGNRKKN